MTREQALMKLPSPYHRQAIDETMRQDKEDGLDCQSELTLAGTLLSSFSWHDSKVGFLYWDRLFDLVDKYDARI